MKTPLLTALTISSAVLLGSLSGLASATQYHKWVDSKGVTHYTKTPPPKSAVTKTKIDTYGWHNSSPTPTRSADPAPQVEPTPQPSGSTDQKQQREANEALQQSQSGQPAV